MSGYAAIGLFGIKDQKNYGGVLRAAQCFGAGAVILETKRLRAGAPNTLRSEKHIPTFLVEDICAATPHGCQKIAVEFLDDAIDLRDFVHPRQAFYIFGPEDGTLGKRVLDHCQHVVRIPTAYCLNLAATVNVVLYDRLAKRVPLEMAA